MKWKKWIPDRKVLSGGLASLAAFLIAAALNAAGIPIEYADVAVAMPFIGGAVAYLIPAAAVDTARHLHDGIIELAVLLPESAATAEGAQRVAEKALAPFPDGSAR
ncbi:hypothetical protein [Nisaea sp.]|uniref:hypothetical protein n=1 Tax=Nisaea sp. TaxID=2024842 RepID=UPI0032989CDF